MSARYHACADIRGLLGKKSLHRTFHNGKDRSLTDSEARDYLYDCLSKGWKVIPFGPCDNFDHQTGCKGHPDVRSVGE